MMNLSNLSELNSIEKRRKAAPLLLGSVLLLSVVFSGLWIRPASASLSSWSPTTSYPTSIGDIDQNCVQSSGFVYCIGGYSGGGPTTAVYFAPLSSSGVGSWSPTTGYPLADWLGSCVADSGFVYCVGGNVGSSSITAAVYFAPLSSSGVGAWTSTTTYPTLIHGQSCAVSSGFVYCISGSTGFTSGVNTPAVYYAPLLGVGGIGAWLPTTNYPAPTYLGSCVVDSGFVYCIGGYFVGSAVYFAQLSPTGVGTWSATTNYPIADGQQACIDHSGMVYCIGGWYGSYLNNVYFASLSSSGVGSWNTAASYPTGIAGQGCVTSSGFVYCIGGYTGSGFTSAVYFAATKDTTSTTISCNPSSVAVNQPTLCTATVTDTSSTPSTPTGTVSFTTSSSGTFTSSNTCTLNPISPSASSCSVTYTPSAVGTGTHIITGTYSGDLSHFGSSGTFNLIVTQCREVDGSGDFHGSNGKGNFHADDDKCEDGNENQVSSTNVGDGKDFQSTQISTTTFDAAANTVTINGFGTHGGVPVAFTFVALETGPTTPGWVSFAFSDGYTNAGTLVDGSILLH